MMYRGAGFCIRTHELARTYVRAYANVCVGLCVRMQNPARPRKMKKHIIRCFLLFAGKTKKSGLF